MMDGQKKKRKVMDYNFFSDLTDCCALNVDSKL